jgi:hypothetical protein
MEIIEQTATRKELRQFGLLVGAVFTVIGLWPLVFRGEPLRLWAIGIGFLLIVCGGIVPSILRPIHKAWMWVGHILGWINTRILLGIVFYALVTPIAIVHRFMGKNTMRQGFAESSTTYRVTRSPRPVSHMKYQF